jgi:hypothetical protein
LGRYGCAKRGVTASHEANQPPLKLGAFDEHVAAADFAAQPDVRAKAIHKPRVCTTRVPPTQADNVAQQESEHGMDGHLFRA